MRDDGAPEPETPPPNRHGKPAAGRRRIPVQCWDAEREEIRRAAELADESMSEYLLRAGQDRARSAPAAGAGHERITRIRDTMAAIDDLAARAAAGAAHVPAADVVRLITLDATARLLRTEDAADLLDYARAKIPGVEL